MHRLRAHDGFTLIEILMVILIVAVLAAIAIPSFLRERDKATDAGAKVQARSAETAMNVYRIDHDGSYACGTSAQCVSELRAIDESLPTGGLGVTDYDGTGSALLDAFRVTTLGAETRTFWVALRPGDREHGCALNGSTAPGGCRGGQW